MSIKIPIGLSRETNKLVNVKEVPNGLECNCYCPACDEPLVAVNKEIKQTAHFRHSKDSNCEFNKNFESYIHWLTKEIFKTIDEFTLPQIRARHLRDYPGEVLRSQVSKLLKEKGIAERDLPYFSSHSEDWDKPSLLQPGNIKLQSPSKIKIEKCLTEMLFRSKIGDVRVDIVLYIENKPLFIEPFLTSKIDEIKYQKIVDLDITTISIDLKGFVQRHDYLFTTEELKDYLINDMHSKKWEYIRKSKVYFLIRKLFERILPQSVDEISQILKKNEETNKMIETKLKKIKSIHREIEILKTQLKSIDVSNILGGV